MIVVHHLENSRSQRILWLLEELGLEYEIRRYERDPVTMLAPAELAAIHPLGKSPVIEDRGSVIAESGAIIEYLLRHYDNGQLRPSGEQDLQAFTFWLHYAEGSLMPWLLLKLVFGRLGKPPMPLPLRPVAALIGAGVERKLIDRRLAEHFAFIDGELTRQEWLAGTDFSAADIQMSFPLEAARHRAGLEQYPNIVTYLARLHARGAYGRALARGGPYDYA